MDPPSTIVSTLKVKFSPAQISLLASSETMLTLALAAGSKTVTVAVQVEILLAKSLTVKVTVLTPKSLQSKAVLSKDMDWMPQLSVEPLSISAVVIVALPEASNVTK